MINHYEPHERHMLQDYRQRFFVALMLTIPILLLSPIIQGAIGLGDALRFPASDYVLWALSTVMFLYGGRPFLSGMAHELRARRPGMMTLIALALCASYLYSAAVIFGLDGMHALWELAALIDVILLGHWISMKAIVRLCDARLPTQRLPILINRMALIFAVIALLASVVTFWAWFFVARVDLAFALERAVTVLLIASPEAVILSRADETSRAGRRNILQSLFLAAAYNIVALPLAAGVLYNEGVVVTPVLAAVFSTVCTLMVVANVQRQNPTKESI